MKYLAFIFILCFAAALAAEPPRPGDKLTGVALWIDDGDTFQLRTPQQRIVRVRLWGIDAPEKNQPGGKESTLFLIALIGRKQVTVTVAAVDKYGRTVGKVRQAERDINLLMVSAGHAWWYRYYAPDAKDLTAAEQSARLARRGLWAQPSPLNPSTWRQTLLFTAIEN